jgi:hypothetical protein
MLSRSINDTSRVIRMMIAVDAIAWILTSDDSRGVIYNCNINIIQARANNAVLLIADAEMFIVQAPSVTVWSEKHILS